MLRASNPLRLLLSFPLVMLCAEPVGLCTTIAGNPVPSFHLGSPAPVSIRSASLHFASIILTRCDNSQEVTITANNSTNYLYSSGPSLTTGVDFCEMRLTGAAFYVEALNDNIWVPIDLELGAVDVPAGEFRFTPGANSNLLHIELRSQIWLNTTTVEEAGEGIDPDSELHDAWVEAVQEAVGVTFAP